jgi:predicted RNA-binding Zn-ribbon protein involved in translation (DUF1610 family)
VAENESSSRKIVISVAATLMASALTWVAALFSATVRGILVAGWAWTKGLLAGAWHFLASPHGVPGWLIVVAVFWAFAALVRWLSSRKRPPAPRQLNELDYTTDMFEGVTWCWSYPGGSISGQPLPRCPACEQVLVFRQETVLTNGGYGGEFGDVTIFRCENCRTDVGRCEGTLQQVQARVVRSIDRKLRTGEWQQVVTHRSTR